MKVLLIIALIIGGLQILADIYSIAKYGKSDLLIHVFDEVVFAITLAHIY